MPNVLNDEAEEKKKELDKEEANKDVPASVESFGAVKPQSTSKPSKEDLTKRHQEKMDKFRKYVRSRRLTDVLGGTPADETPYIGIGEIDNNGFNLAKVEISTGLLTSRRVCHELDIDMRRAKTGKMRQLLQDHVTELMKSKEFKVFKKHDPKEGTSGSSAFTCLSPRNAKLADWSGTSTQ